MITPRKTWILVGAAMALFCFIFFFERHIDEEVAGPEPILPGLSPAQIDVVQVIPADGREIRAERTNGTWQLVRPVNYPANAAVIDAMLEVFSLIKPQARISAAELGESDDPDKEFGLDSPQATVILQQQDHRVQLKIGRATVMGDQTFLQIVGADNLNIVTSDLLKIIPVHEDQWRDLRFFSWSDAAFDRIVITNKSMVIELKRDASSRAWQMKRPIEARADTQKIDFLLQQLQSTRVASFVDDAPDLDASSYGLNPPSLSLHLTKDTNHNHVALFQFGQSITTNGFDGTYARRVQRPGVILAPTMPLSVWKVGFNEFRDRHLVSLAPNTVEEVSISGLGDFTLTRTSNAVWRVSGPSGEFPAEAELVREFFSILNDLTVSEFVKDVVSPADLPNYGFVPPSRKFVLKTAGTNEPTDTTNSVLAQIEFGKVEENKILVRRADEGALYAMKLTDFSRLPAEAWQFRRRQIWDFRTNDIVRLTVENQGRKRDLLREGPYRWSFAPGSQGVINDLAVEEVAAELGRFSAAAWVDQGTENRVRLGFQDPAPSVTVEVRSGAETKQLRVEFGGVSPSEFPYAGTRIDGEYLIFEFPLKLYHELQLYVFPPSETEP